MKQSGDGARSQYRQVRQKPSHKRARSGETVIISEGVAKLLEGMLLDILLFQNSHLKFSLAGSSGRYGPSGYGLCILSEVLRLSESLGRTYCKEPTCISALCP
jgi:hypothetical protein